MPSTRKKHCKGSHSVGQLVEICGIDKKNRGVGIILSEVNRLGDVEEEKTLDSHFDHVVVYWQMLGREEILHKRYITKIPDIERK